jgi:protein SCO1/2
LTARLSPKLVAGLFFCLLLAAGLALVNVNREAAPPSPSSPAEPLIAGAFDPPHIAPEFTLTGSNGSGVTLSRYRGKVVLLTFGFTRCAAVCPTTLATLAQARRNLGNAASTVQVIYVTVDPARDTAALMKDYLAAFDPTFIGATGDKSALASVMQKYGVTATKQGSGPDYAMAHTSSIFLIDPAGKLRGLMPYGHDAADFVHDIRYLSAH